VVPLADLQANGIICLVLGVVLGIPSLVHFAVLHCDAQHTRRATAYSVEALDDSPADDMPGLGMRLARPVVDSEPISTLEYLKESGSANGTPRIRSQGQLRMHGGLP